MRIAWTLIAMLPLLSACSDGIEVCDIGGKNCQQFRSYKHLERWANEENARQRVKAAQFPDDYRDVVAAILEDYLGSDDPEVPRLQNRYFIEVFGEDLDEETRSKLRRLGIESEPGSQYREHVYEDAAGVHGQSVNIYVSAMRHLANGTYRVEFGYRCGGSLCAGHYAYKLRKERGVWVFTSRKALWFS